MIKMLKLLLEKIKNDCIIKNELFEDYNIDDVLDLRDDEIFDAEWCRVYNKIKDLEIKQEDLTIIDEIRKYAYLKTYSITNSPDISGYISDDFELITKAYILGINDEWLNSVIYFYANDMIPCGEINKSSSNINKVINQLINKVN